MKLHFAGRGEFAFAAVESQAGLLGAGAGNGMGRHGRHAHQHIEIRGVERLLRVLRLDM